MLRDKPFVELDKDSHYWLARELLWRMAMISIHKLKLGDDHSRRLPEVMLKLVSAGYLLQLAIPYIGSQCHQEKPVPTWLFVHAALPDQMDENVYTLCSKYISDYAINTRHDFSVTSSWWESTLSNSDPLTINGPTAEQFTAIDTAVDLCDLTLRTNSNYRIPEKLDDAFGFTSDGERRLLQHLDELRIALVGGRRAVLVDNCE